MYIRCTSTTKSDVQCVHQTEGGEEEGGPGDLQPHTGAVQPLSTRPLVSGPRPGTGIVVVVVVVVVVGAVVPVDTVVVALRAVRGTGGVQPVRVEGVGGGGGGPGSGASPLRLGGAPGPAEQQKFSNSSIQRNTFG